MIVCLAAMLGFFVMASILLSMKLKEKEQRIKQLEKSQDYLVEGLANRIEREE